MSVDPANEQSFYLIGQFAREYNNAAGGHPGGTGGSRWGTWVANVTVTASGDDLALLRSLGDDLKFVFITSAATVAEGSTPAVEVKPSTAKKCERCWHWRDDVGTDPAHPTLCGRCTSNLFGAGEPRCCA